MNKRIIIISGLIVLLMALVAGFFLTTQQQDIREKADEPTTAPQNPFMSPTPPPQQCGGDDGICQWDAIPGAAGYCYRIEKKVGDEFFPLLPKTTKEDCISTKDTKVVFSMESGIPYRCTVKITGTSSICEQGATDQATLTCGQITPTSPIGGSITPTSTTGTPGVLASVTPIGASPTTIQGGGASATPLPSSSSGSQQGGGTQNNTSTTTTSGSNVAPTTAKNNAGSEQLPRAGLLDYSVVIIGLGLLVVAVGFVL